MRSILIPIGGADGQQGALSAALHVAHRFDGYLEGLFAQRVSPMLIGDGMAVAPAFLPQVSEDWRAEASAARAAFEAFMAEQGVPMVASAAEAQGLAAGWREVESPESQIVGAYGRLFDLIAVGRQGPAAEGDLTVTCEAALFETGRPVLLAPREPVAALGRTVVIAWNGATETARTIALGLPLVRLADKVTVLTVEGGTVPGPSGEDVAAHLRRHCPTVEAVTAQPGGRSTGETILEEAVALGADLILKGAYTHSRLRQMVLGGATRHIMAAATLPVLMAH